MRQWISFKATHEQYLGCVQLYEIQILNDGTYAALWEPCIVLH